RAGKAEQGRPRSQIEPLLDVHRTPSLLNFVGRERPQSGNAKTLIELPTVSGVSMPAARPRPREPVCASPFTTATYCLPPTAYVIVLVMTGAPSGSDCQRCAPLRASKACS